MGTLINAGFKNNSFDAITLLDVIEHLPDPESEIILIKNILKRGGLFLINTPDTDSFFAKLMGKKWYALIPPEHLVYFNYKSLSYLLEKNGFSIIYKDRIAKRFTIQYCTKILANWLKFRFTYQIAEYFEKGRHGKIALPINLRDNFLIIARKI